MIRVAAPTFEIVSSPTIKITDIKSRRFNLIDRGDEPSVALIINNIEYYYGAENKCAVKEYIVQYIKDHRKFDNLRKALEKVAPQYVDTLDKLSVLK